jgi:hypothetical protein
MVTLDRFSSTILDIPKTNELLAGKDASIKL